MISSKKVLRVALGLGGIVFIFAGIFSSFSFGFWVGCIMLLTSWCVKDG